MGDEQRVPACTYGTCSGGLIQFEPLHLDRVIGAGVTLPLLRVTLRRRTTEKNSELTSLYGAAWRHFLTEYSKRCNQSCHYDWTHDI